MSNRPGKPTNKELTRGQIDRLLLLAGPPYRYPARDLAMHFQTTTYQVRKILARHTAEGRGGGL